MFRRLLPYVSRYRRAFLIGLVCVVLTTAFQLLGPWVLKFAIDDLNRGVTRQKLLLYAGLLLGVSLVRGSFLFLMRRIIIAASRDIEYDIRNDFFARLEQQPLGYYHQRRTGDLMSRATNDLNAVRMMIGPAIMYSAQTVLVFVVAIALMVTIDLRLTLIALIPLPFVSLAVRYFGSAIHKRFESIQAQLADVSAVVQEALSGVRVVRAYRQESHEIARFNAANEEYLHRNRVLIRLQGAFYPSMTLFLALGSLLVLWLGGREVIHGRISLGEFVAFNGYLVMLSWPMIAFGWVTNILQRGLASWGRMLEILDHEPAITDAAATEAGRAAAMDGAIEIRDLTFQYPGTAAPVLKHITLRIEPGQTVALVGPTGSGKSTLISLLPRLHDPPSGTVTVGGVDIREIPLARLRGAVGFVPQEPFLFSDTIAENVAFGAAEQGVAANDAETKEAADHAADHAEAADHADHAEAADLADHAEAADHADHAETQESKRSAYSAYSAATKEPTRSAYSADSAAIKELTRSAHSADSAATKESTRSAYSADSAAIKELTRSAYSADSAATKEPTRSAHSADSAATKESNRSAHSADSAATKEPTRSAYSADSAATKESNRSAHSADSAATKESTRSAHSADSAAIKEPTRSAYSADSAATKESTRSAYSADSAATKESTRSAHSADSAATKESTRSAYSADAAATKEPTRSAYSADSAATKESTRSAHSADSAAIKEPTRSAYSADSAATKEPTRSAYSADSAAIKERNRSAYSADSAATKEPTRSAYSAYSAAVVSAASVARLDKDVADFPRGFDTTVGERGITLSGGQKQRTALARALMTDPRILILDDALSAVDTYTEEEILSRLRGVMRQRTSIIVSHRISTVRGADQIFVLHDGRVAERGTHDDLVRRDGLYAAMYRKQLLEEELQAS